MSAVVDHYFFLETCMLFGNKYLFLKAMKVLLVALKQKSQKIVMINRNNKVYLQITMRIKPFDKLGLLQINSLSILTSLKSH
jgi:hypothetical protein